MTLACACRSTLGCRSLGRRSVVGMTLVEVLVAMAIMAFIAIAMYSAIDSMRISRSGVERITDRYREGRLAIGHMTRELASAYLSAQKPIDESYWVKRTLFKGDRGSPASRVDFNSFSNRRLTEGSRESDQLELSYFGGEDPDKDHVIDLLRRSNAMLDDRPEKGGRVDVLATDIDLFDLSYLDPLTARWVDEWDSTSVVGERGRLPRQIKIVLVLNGGERGGDSDSRKKIRFVTKVSPMIRDPLTFALK
jgi:general secretion pathway protein J